jgi:hypothetical protein
MMLLTEILINLSLEGSASLELRIHLSICFKTEEVQANEYRDGWSQDRPDAYRFLT